MSKIHNLRLECESLYKIRYDLNTTRYDDRIAEINQELEELINPNNLPIVVCSSCGEEFYSNNQNDFYCENCAADDYFIDDFYQDNTWEDYTYTTGKMCNCEDFPCCGH